MKFQRWESFNKISKKYERWIRIYMIRMVNEFQIQDGGDNVFDRRGKLFRGWKLLGVRKLSRGKKKGR